MKGVGGESNFENLSVACKVHFAIAAQCQNVTHIAKM